ncbi:MAG TPA: LysM peptidoglycan-binding domain-containing protein [Dictyoglomaceae bacterium]|nr:LysM peptidoglycan-binding domain-containing protein [Dictyoglomaceae bacterium]HOP94708.1 LysM peptidoglycan-binding domain-containing protein [Dictyoglomaceae bacterium]HPU43057.1 LysM peptidoglycan-binding domain-containing protein [Dictyoglomaceae bacterium]
MKRFLKELLIYSISFLIVAFLTSQLFSLERIPVLPKTEEKVAEETVPLDTQKTYTAKEQIKSTSTMAQEQKKEEVSSTSVTQTGTQTQIIYEVKVGDTTIGIAEKFGVDWREIAKINKLKDPNYLVVGQKLIIPSK